MKTLECAGDTIAARVTAKVSAELWGHRILKRIASTQDYPEEIRALAAAIARVELEGRKTPTRVLEYVYVALRLPHHARVTIGPAQIRYALVRRCQPLCTCWTSEYPVRLLHCVGSEHQAHALLAETARLSQKYPRRYMVANAYNKGESASDIRLITMYSRVVTSVAMKYVAAIAKCHQTRTTDLRAAAMPNSNPAVN